MKGARKSFRGEWALLQAQMIEYLVRRDARPPTATVSSHGLDVAGIKRDGDKVVLRAESDGSWWMEPRVDGEIRPFSMSAVPCAESGEPALTIRNHLFFHRGKAYFLTGIPEDVRPADHLLGKRHVNRLDTFPFSSLKDVDPQTWGRLRSHRGVSVGTIEATASGEYRVMLSDELREVGIPLVAASFLLYTSG